MKRVSDRFFQLAVLGALVGMGLGVMMGKNEDFTLAPVHAHINLLIWVSMTLYALFYRAVPKATAGVLPVIHFGLNVLSVLVLLPALAKMLLGDKSVAPLVGAASIGVWASMLLFAFIVWRATWRAEASDAAETRKAA